MFLYKFLYKKIISIIFYLFIFLQSFISFSHEKDSLNSKSICFIENKGQWGKNILYKLELDKGAIFFEKNCFTFTFGNIIDINNLIKFKFLSKDIKKQKNNPNGIIHFHAYRMNFIGCNKNIEVKASDPTIDYNNYFIGNDPNK